MELKDYLKIIGKKIWLFLIIVFIVTIGTYFLTINQPISYDGSTTLNVVVKKPVSYQQNYYNYDNYYALQGCSLFADTVVAWLQDPSTVLEIYDKAGLQKPELSLKNLSKIIKAHKKPPASVYITYNNTDKTAVEKLIKATAKYAEEKTETWSNEGLIDNLHIASTTPVVIEHKPAIMLNTLFGLVGGLLIGLAVIFFQEYMKKN